MADTNDKSMVAEAKKRFEDEFAAATRGIKRPNILLLGKTGAGKSSLVNMVFGSNLADVGHVAPLTRGFHEYSLPAVPVNIIDSEGYELEGEEGFRRSLADYISRNFSDITRQVHIAWLCISTGTNRVMPFDIQIVRLLQANSIPVAVVLTQCDLDTPTGDCAAAMRRVVVDEFGPDVPCFEVSNDPAVNDELGQLPGLIQWSKDNLPDANLRLGFIAAQRVSLAEKDKAAEMRVRWYAGAAGGVGATPLPVSDAVVLTGLQMKMSADIYAIYGFDNTLRHGLQDFVQGKIASAVGKLVAGNIIKAVPVGGQIVGSVVNAGVAGSITYALGRTVATACSHACKAVWKGDTAAVDMIFNVENLYGIYNDTRARVAARFNPAKTSATNDTATKPR